MRATKSSTGNSKRNPWAFDMGSFTSTPSLLNHVFGGFSFGGVRVGDRMERKNTDDVISVRSDGGAAVTTFHWATTSPNPSAPQTGFDAGQRGWRLHAVAVQPGEQYGAYKRRPALCGLWPRHGWGLDLFIDSECAKCLAAITKREAAGAVFVDLAEMARRTKEATALAEDGQEE
jgi:hypothetical protein